MPKGTKAEADLSLLTALERGEVVTQAELKQNVGVSVGLINALLKRAVSKGLVKMRQAPYKRYAYYLTPKGFSEKSRLVAAYLENSFRLFRQAREEYEEIFQDIMRLDAGQVVFVGSGELAEIALLASFDLELEVRGIYDGKSNADRICSLKVFHSLDDICEADVLVITDSRHPQSMFDKISERFGSERVFAPACLRVVRDWKEIKAPKAVPGEARQ
jgi:DNA-binding MarR family transcriptional regulator